MLSPQNPINLGFLTSMDRSTMSLRPRMRVLSSSVSQSQSLGSETGGDPMVSAGVDIVRRSVQPLSRVYAKISRVEMDEHPQRLDGIGQSQSAGLIL